ncbi:uncharacterized protein METZ01_LOCUS232710, partial [marine metagenome]|jgi:hypothetical protein
VFLRGLIWRERRDGLIIAVCMNTRAPNVLLFLLLFGGPEGQRDSVSGVVGKKGICVILYRNPAFIRGLPKVYSFHLFYQKQAWFPTYL